MDKAYIGSSRVGYTRCNVYQPDMDDAILSLQLNPTASALTCMEIVSFNSDGTPNYNPITVTGSIQPRGSNLKGLPVTDQAKYNQTLLTPGDVAEADRVIDCTGTLYDVHDCTAYWRFDSFIGYQCELFKLEPVLHKRRVNASAYTYTDKPIYMSLSIRGQSSINPQEYYGHYDYVGVTINKLAEGDRIVTKDGDTYEVMQATVHPFTRNDLAGGWTVAVLVKAFPTVTLRTLSLGAADPVTGIYAASYAESTAYMQIFNPSKGMVKTPAGYYGKYDFIGLTSASVAEGDQVTYNGATYEITQVTSYPAQRTDISLHWRVCGLTKRDFATQPATSGTWHLDSTSAKTDPRLKIKSVIDTYLTASNIKKDDGATNAATAAMFGDVSYPVTRLFLTKALDAVAVISRGASNVLYTDWVFGHKPYGFEEAVKIEICAVNKDGVTASNLVEKFEQEIRRIFTAYDPYSNVRDLDTIEPTTVDLGYTQMCKTTVNIRYKRCNDDYTPTTPTITWGPSAAPTGTYTFPNITNFQLRDPDTGDVRILPPGRIGDLLQILGSSDFDIVLTCDLSVEPAAKTWKRAQASTKTDVFGWQVFEDIKFGGKTDATKIYQTFNYGGSASIPVRVIDVSVDGEVLTVALKRYSSSSGSGGTYSAWYGN